MLAAKATEVTAKRGDTSNLADEINPTVAELEEVREYLNNPSIPQSNVEKDKKIRRLLSRMTPYSKALDGTALMMANEKRKLLCLLTAPVVVTKGDWQFFLTFAQADVYDHKLFDILMEG
jgi:hypothetical protein